jgi:hypothetical protein
MAYFDKIKIKKQHQPLLLLFKSFKSFIILEPLQLIDYQLVAKRNVDRLRV